MSNIISLLDAINIEAKQLGFDPAANMHPGLTRDQIKEVSRRLPFELPADVIEIYHWRNGVRLEGQHCEYRLFPRYCLRTIEESVQTTQLLISLADDPLIRWRHSWFGLFEDLAGDCLACETNRSGEFGRIFASESEIIPAFWSVETMLTSVLECYRAGAYFLDDVLGYLTEDEEISDVIYRRFNRGLSPHYSPPDGSTS